MEIEELIQLIRTCNLAQVRKELGMMKADGTDYSIIALFYKRASRRKR